MQSPQRRRLKRSRVLFLVSGILLCFIYTLSLKTRQPQAPIRTDVGSDRGGEDAVEVGLREVRASNETEEEMIVNRTDLEQCIYVHPRLPRARPTPPPLTTTAPPKQPLQPPQSKVDYPEDYFSVRQRRQGWVFLHVTGMIYMFVALAIVCDEFFVPALEVITAKLEISDDVAGATFMAAGGSAPELFTSLIGVFISHSNVGIGTIVGSAVFNILFVIGMCAIVSREMLRLTWWPLFRDVTFYILDLIMLIAFFSDNMIWWWESIILVLGYVSYVVFMKFNSQLERTFKRQLNKHKSIVKDSEAAQPPRPAADPKKTESKPKHEVVPPVPSSPQHNSLQPESQEDKALLRVRPVLQRGGSSASLHNMSLRSTIFQLMMCTLDPLGEAVLRMAIRASRRKKITKDAGDLSGSSIVRRCPHFMSELLSNRKFEDSVEVTHVKSSVVHFCQSETSFNGDVKGEGLVQKKAKNKVKPLDVPVRENQENWSHHPHAEGQKPKSEQTASFGAPGGAAAQPSTSQPPAEETTQKTSERPEESKAVASEGRSGGSQDSAEEDGGEDESSDSSESKEEDNEEEEETPPLSLKWPAKPRKQATYLLLLPIMFLLWLTLPDVRKPASRKFLILTFLGSIFWISIFSYLMVWWAHQIGETIGISEEVMGLTILAAGTSIPDLITSVIVARKGLGDMAVSSSVGSNIFDITVGLPIPWLLYSVLHNGEAVTVSSNGLFCTIVLLFLMLLFVIISIAASRWKMSKKLGITMFILYFVFVVFSVLLEYQVLICPVSI
ncbi:sodium/potassium/calcium exchanger 2-like isoform X2 [Girardinichthys multiradiatus]|uniref:sodium/potassium/calcium exchanger 2-like isoform X2 n=1 Tax=Girardinichthys multiradiatus TaxID=208333 RepID=UPI001FAB4C93|nr:sodium/potassium/calcium exchanger 2-like isoform X2 [Girardinichthys multiradiatus]